MRGYACHFYHLTKKNTLVKNNNTACWAGINRVPPISDVKIHAGEELDEANKEYIFVDQFVQPETEAYIPLLIRVLNKITPCEMVTIDDKQYIKIKLIGKYDNSLIVLNFLRNLWSCPSIFNGQSPAKAIYTPTFFETLKNARKYKDGLKRLMWANKAACEKIPGCGSMGHSNIHNADRLTIRSAEDLKNWNGYSTEGFLTGLPNQKYDND
jgi:hypothetical protein